MGGKGRRRRLVAGSSFTAGSPGGNEGRPTTEEEPEVLERQRRSQGQKGEGEEGEDWWGHNGKMVITPVSLTLLAQNPSKMAHTSTNFECMAHRYLQDFLWHVRN
jgi:hypothetical protein